MAIQWCDPTHSCCHSFRCKDWGVLPPWEVAHQEQHTSLLPGSVHTNCGLSHTLLEWHLQIWLGILSFSKYLAVALPLDVIPTMSARVGVPIQLREHQQREPS